jgi:transcription termination/antitermination protein NusG
MTKLSINNFSKMGELNWYVIRAVAGQERKVKSYLENEIIRQNMTDFIPQVIISIEKVFEIRNGKKRVREKNTLPGYIIIQADLTHGEALHTITSIPGVIGFLGANNGKMQPKTPIPLRLAEINRLLGKVEEQNQQEEKLDIPFVIGETLTVMEGPFKGFKGVVEEVFEEKKRLKITVKIFGRNNPMELSYTQVEKES